MKEPQVGDKVEFICGMPGPDVSDGLILRIEGDTLVVWDDNFRFEHKLKISAYESGVRCGSWSYKSS
jgi:hypothetical protein